MSTPRAYAIFVTYGDAIYVPGGYNDGGELSSMERYSRGLGWQTMAGLPFSNHRSVHLMIINLFSNNLYLPDEDIILFV